MTTTEMPNMTNPEALTTVPELREELHRANDLLLKLGDRLHGLMTTTHQLGEALSGLMLLHIAGKTEDVISLLNDIQAKHVRVVSETPSVLH